VFSGHPGEGTYLLWKIPQGRGPTYCGRYPGGGDLPIVVDTPGEGTYLLWKIPRGRRPTYCGRYPGGGDLPIGKDWDS